MTGRDDDVRKTVRRLRRWPVAQKRRIVEETLVPGASVAIVARHNNVNANQVFDWRKQYREGTLVDRKAAKAASAVPTLLRIGVVNHKGGISPLPIPAGCSTPPSHETGKASVSPGSNRPAPGMIVIELPNRVKVRVEACIDESALRRVLAVAREVA